MRLIWTRKPLFKERDAKPHREAEPLHGDVGPGRVGERMRKLLLRHEHVDWSRGSPVRLLPRCLLDCLDLRPHSGRLHPQIQGHHLFRKGSTIPNLEEYIQVLFIKDLLGLWLLRWGQMLYVGSWIPGLNYQSKCFPSLVEGGRKNVTFYVDASLGVSLWNWNVSIAIKTGTSTPWSCWGPRKRSSREAAQRANPISCCWSAGWSVKRFIRMKLTWCYRFWMTLIRKFLAAPSTSSSPSFTWIINNLDPLLMKKKHCFFLRN